MTATAQAAPAIPFPIASRQQDRFSFSPPMPTSLGATTTTQLTTIQVPATAFLRGILIECSATISGGTPQVTADSPWNFISSIGIRSAEGTPLIVPLTGYQLFQINKYGGQTWVGENADPRVGYDFDYTVASSMHFFLWLPFEIDRSNGLGSLPALAANRNYQVDITLNSIQGQFGSTTPPTSVVPVVTAYAFYWSQPAAANSVGQTQVQSPNKAVSKWLLETPTLTPGDQYITSNAVGNIVRAQIFTMRNSSAARIDTNGWPNLFQYIVDNEVQHYFTRREFEYLMTKWYGLTSARATGKDVAGALDTGVYALPFFTLAGSLAGNPNDTRAQLLSTNSATQLQLLLQQVGSAGSKLEILTQTLSAAPSTAYGK